MESVQTSSQRSAAAAQGVRHGKGAGKAAGADGLSQAPGQGQQDAFALLLGALGGDEGEPLAPSELASDAAPATAPWLSGAAPHEGLATAMGWTPTLLAAQDAAVQGNAGTGQQAGGASALHTLAGATAGGLPGVPGRLAEGLTGLGAAGSLAGPLGNALMEGAAAVDGLVAQTALLDKGGELAHMRAGALGAAFAGVAQARARAAAGLANATANAGGVAGTLGLGAAASGLPTSVATAANALGAQAAALLQQTDQRLQSVVVQVHERATAVHDAAASLSAPSWAAAQELLPERPAPALAGESQAPLAAGVALSAAGEPLDHATHAVPDGSTVASEAAQAAAEEQLAEQVAFWVNQQTQSAEMTLDREGQPVQVRVELTGNEARITFLSDQAQTREALDAGMAQLRELLEQQGMVLAGVTVGGGGAAGTSAQGQGGGAEGRPAGRPSGRAPVAVPTAETAPVRHTPTGSHPGVDLFV